MTGASEAVRSAVAAALPASRRPVTGWSGPHPRSWSWHFGGFAGNARIVVKIPRWEGVDTLEAALDAGPQADTAGEFAALETIARAVAASGDDGLAAVVPVAYVPAVNAIVLEWLEGDPVRTWLGPRVPRAVSDPILAAVGRWIGVYQGAVGDWTAGPFDGAAAAARWRDAAPSSGLAASLEAVAGLAERLDRREVATGTIHGDLTLSNVLVTPDGRVAVIDPNRYRGTSLDDAARLGGELLAGRSRLLTGGLAPGPDRARGRVAALADGLGEHDPEMFRYALAAACARRWLDLRGRRGPGGLVGSLASRLFRAEITRLAG